jgi:hypothetical protein
MSHSPSTLSLRRARRSFWILVAVSVLAVGALSDALAAPPAPTTGLRVAGSGLVLAATTALAARVLLALDSATAPDRDTQSQQAQQSRLPVKENHP